MESASSASDETLMLRYQAGDYDAFESLYARHAPKVYGYLRKRVPAGSDPSELLQIVFLKLHQHRGKYRPEFPFLPWLFTLTRNSLIDQARRTKKEGRMRVRESFDETRAPEAREDEDPMTVEARLNAVLESLPRDQRELIKMRFEEGLSFEAISRRLGTNATTLRKRVSRVIERLRRTMPEEGK